MNGGKDSFKNRILDHFFEPIMEEEDTEVSSENHTVEYNNDDTELRVEPFIVDDELTTVKEPTIISAQTVIRGNIMAENDVEISGEVIGDVSADGLVKVLGGKITGNIKALKILIKNSRIQGYLDSEGFIDIIDDSEIIGDITGGDIVVDSKCEGNIVARERLKLLQNANIHGDLQTKIIKIDEGAIVEGRLRMS